jgi:AcrR family transcriptional regulator
VGNLGLTVQEVVKRAGVTTGALYGNFVNREGLIAEAYAARMRADLNQAATMRHLSTLAFTKDPHSDATYDEMRRALMARPGRLARLRWLEGVTEAVYSEPMRVHAQRLTLEVRAAVTSDIQTAQRNGWIRSDLTAESIAIVWLSLGIGLSAVLSDADDDNQRLVDEVLRGWHLSMNVFRTNDAYPDEINV